jgi:Uri superfamily endonuclease
MAGFLVQNDENASRLLPKAGGAYILLIDVVKPQTLPQKRFAGTVLEPGTYLYCGSAYGPGGLNARVLRHFKPEKKIRWHVDVLTSGGAGRVTAAWIEEGGDECRLSAMLCESERVAIPVPGFGSSDCALCPTHLLSCRDVLIGADFFAEPEGV